MSEEEKPANGKRSLKSTLGWLSQSSSQSKKRKEIEGIFLSFTFYHLYSILKLFYVFNNKIQITSTSPSLILFSLPTAPGVSAASLVALKSQLAKKQEEVSGHGVRHALPADAKSKRHRGGGTIAALLQNSNPGVAERDRVDRISVKVRESTICHVSSKLFRIS